MCELAEIHTGRDVLHLRVEDMEFDDVFHGIWACSVLGHFAPNKIHEVLGKILDALKDDGILYFSVRKGERKGMYSGRYYCDYDRDSLDDLLIILKSLIYGKQVMQEETNKVSGTMCFLEKSVKRKNKNV